MQKRSSANEKTRRLRVKPLLAALLIGLLVTQVGGCTTVSYYGQSIVGHSKLMLARQPLEKALATAEQGGQQELAKQLTLAVDLRQFAVESLGLPDNGSYQSYVDLQRDFPVWTVVAAEEFSLQPKQWCYLVIGCASYRGYFSKASAVKFAAALEQEGYDVAVGGAPAYSTLGWFDDPLLPSMMRYGEAQFAETLFHELAHQVFYLNGDSDVNEAFATTVGEHGAKRWLHTYKPDALSDYIAWLNATDDFNQLLISVRSHLERIYSEPHAPVHMREEKQKILHEFRVDYQTLKNDKWSNKGWFDAWFSKPANNARLAAIATYRDKVPIFDALLANCEYEFKRFYASVQTIKAGDDEIKIPLECVES